MWLEMCKKLNGSQAIGSPHCLTFCACNLIVWISFQKIILSMKFSQGLVLFRMLSIGPIFSILLRDHVSSKVIVILTIILTIAWEEVLILTFTNKPKLLVLFYGILVYTRISWHILRIPEGKYVIDLFSDDGIESLVINAKQNTYHVHGGSLTALQLIAVERYLESRLNFIDVVFQFPFGEP